MEKLVYVLWRGDRDAVDVPGNLHEVTAPALMEAGARFVKMSVVDDAVAAGEALRIGSQPADKDAVVSFWLEESIQRFDCEAIIAAAADTFAGYLVTESRPLRTPSVYLHGPGERTDGFHLVTCIRGREDLSQDEFITQWHGPFRDTAIDGQNTWDYVRNEIVRPLTPDAPGWSAIVEEGFPIEALDDPAVFFDAVGDEDRLATQQNRMFEMVQTFLDLTAVDSHPMSEYVFEVGPD
jgi:hypothetical protein